MAWERRRNQRFFYKSVRVGGKVKKIYFGKGPVAELAAMAVEQRQRFRKERAAADRRARENYLQVTVEFDRLACELDELVTGMSVVGYREHDRKFKSCNSKKEESTMPIGTQCEAGEPVKDLADTPENLNAESGDRTFADACIPGGKQPVVESDFRQLVEKANQGDVDAMMQLREVLDQHCNGRTARALNGHGNGQVKSAEAVVNGAHVEPDLCFKEIEPANGRPVNRILRFSVASRVSSD